MNARSPRGDGQSYNVLLVESDPDGVEPFVEAFEATGYTDSVHVLDDGDDALEFLHGRGDFADAPRPDLVLLDLHVSDGRGHDVLRELNDEPELRMLPVLVVTDSDAEEDVVRSYELNANAYVHKPSTPEEYEALAEAIEGFWLRLVHLPSP